MACGGKRLLYFSSCSVVGERNTSTPYVEHKQRMESLVLSSSNGVVIRLPQVVGRTPNPVTFANFIWDRVLSGEHFSVWAHAERNLIDVDDVVAISSVLLKEVDGGSVRAIAAPQSKKVTEVVEIFETYLARKRITRWNRKASRCRSRPITLTPWLGVWASIYRATTLKRS